MEHFESEGEADNAIIEMAVRFWFMDDDWDVDKGLLEDNGINCVVYEDALASLYPAPDVALGRIKLYIDDDKLELANRLLEEAAKEQTAEEGQE
jgi:hypothetical protein